LRDQEKVRERELREQKKKEELASMNRHWSEKKLEQMEERDWRIFMEDQMISVRGVDVPRPLRFWKEGRLPEPIQMALVKNGYREPSSLQRQVIPIATAKKDFIAIAAHGQSHAAAVVIPVLCHVGRLPKLTLTEMRKHGPYAVILAPTREAVRVIEAEAKKFLTGYSTRCVGLVDTTTNVEGSIAEQFQLMKEGAEVIIGTPTRVQQFFARGHLLLNQCYTVVLDETEKMMSSAQDQAHVKQLLDAMPGTCACTSDGQEKEKKID
jgi:ATP-dependent RNA helicase DDX23/PRP28